MRIFVHQKHIRMHTDTYTYAYTRAHMQTDTHIHITHFPLLSFLSCEAPRWYLTSPLPRVSSFASPEHREKEKICIYLCMLVYTYWYMHTYTYTYAHMNTTQICIQIHIPANSVKRFSNGFRITVLNIFSLGISMCSMRMRISMRMCMWMCARVCMWMSRTIDSSLYHSLSVCLWVLPSAMRHTNNDLLTPESCSWEDNRLHPW